ncbi:MAG: T9SS type A sorting domain-containing protein [Candidatus Sabulitectum sp.]|nr:T9SS type A sorting domain-containing protein [Candidatus Sabulitectum sp.]
MYFLVLTLCVLSDFTAHKSGALIPTDNMFMQCSSSQDEPGTPGLGEWTGHGPWGGKVNVLVTAWNNDSIVLAGCGDYYAPDIGGVFKSTDGGITWAETELFPINVTDICSGGPQAPNSFYAATRTGLYLSQDLGETWTVIAGLDSSHVIAIGASYGDGDILIAGLGNLEGVRRTDDGGITWDGVGLSTGYMNGFGCDPIHPDTMYIASTFMGGGHALFRSTDAGVSWRPIGPSGYGWGLLVAPFGTGETILLTTSDGFYMTENYGTDWELVVEGSSYAPAACDGTNLYAPVISDGGVYESTDHGQIWTLNTQGIYSSYWQAGTATSIGFLAGHLGGVYRTSTPGENYTVSQNGIGNGYFYSLSYTSSNNTLLAGGYMHGLWKSNDLGATWEIVIPGPGNWSICDIAPESDQHYNGPVRYAATYDGIYRSEDEGDNWEEAGLPGIAFSSVAFHPSNEDNAWAGAFENGVYYTTDGGSTWTWGTGLPCAFYPAIELMENLSGDIRILVSYQSDGDGVYYSDDGGASYTEVYVPGSNHPDLSANWGTPVDPVVYLTADTGIWRSFDYGETWSCCTSPYVMSWEVLGTIGANVFSGDDGCGVQWSADFGETWQPLSTGIEGKVLWDIVYGASPNQLFASLKGLGVFELTDNQLEILTDNQLRIVESEDYDHLSIYPSSNPVISSVSFIVTGNENANGELSIFSPAGRIVFSREIVAENEPVWQPGEEIPEGVYLVRFTSGSETASSKLVLIR